MPQQTNDRRSASPRRAIAPEELSRRIEHGDAPRIVDVRSGREYRAAHLPGAVHIPFWQMPWRASETVGGEDEIVLLCGHGPRAWVAGAALRLAGHRGIRYLRGHMAGWFRRGLPVER